MLVRSGGPGFRTKNPDQLGTVRNSGPPDRTINRLVRISGPPDRTKINWSGIPDHRTGPMLLGPEFRTTGPDQYNLVRNSGPPDRTKIKLVRNSGPRTGPDQIRTGGPDIHGQDCHNYSKFQYQ